MRQIPELLAPVGGEEQLRAAVENGADAVYMGGRSFHARANAGCFGGEGLTEAVRYAHSKGVKVYITLNTLVTDEEMEAALSQAEECYRAGVDALIVQDFGLARQLRQRLPQMELHLSTQGTVYDREGVLKAEELGFARVVLARETPFSQIAAIASSVDVPLEVFVHGALCMCYSGQCQMSRFQGGRSGNRGGCAQPCRLPYELLRSSGRNSGQSGCSAYRLSPKDMCTVDHLGQLAEAGVASLKIEGRMKSPEYVAIVTGIYRKYLDLYQRDGGYEVSLEDRRALLQIFNRGGFTDGYLWENPRKDILSGRLSKHQGIPLGKVIKVRTAGQGGTIRQFLTVRLIEDIHLGDGVEVQGTDGEGRTTLAGNIVTYIGTGFADSDRKKQGRSMGKSWREAKAGQTVEIGDIPGQARPGQWVYRISEKEQLRQARRTFALNSGQAKKESRKLPVNMALFVQEGRPLRLTVTMAQTAVQGKQAVPQGKRIAPQENPTEEVLTAEAVSEQLPERAINRPLDEEGARRQLEKTGDTMFFLQEMKLVGDDGMMVRASALNQLRREGLERLTRLWEESQTIGRGATPSEVGGRIGDTTLSGDASQSDSVTRHVTSETSKSAGTGWHDTPEMDGARLSKDAKLLKGTSQLDGAERHAASDSEAWKNEGEQMPGLKTLYLFFFDEEMLRLARTAGYDRFYFSYQAFLNESARRRLRELAETGKQVFGWLPPVTQGREGRWIEARRDDIVSALKEVPGAALAVNNLGQLRLFGYCGLRLYGDYGLNLYNSADFAWAKEQGLFGAMVSHEAFDNGFENPMKELPCRFGLEGEVAVAGRVPLMISAHCPIGDATGCRGPKGGALGDNCGLGACDSARYALRDRKNRCYPILTEKMDCRATIFSEPFREAADGRLKAIREAGYHIRTYGIDPTVFQS